MRRLQKIPDSVWAAATGVIVIVAFMFSGFALRNSRDVGRQSRLALCREVGKSRDALRAIIELSRARALMGVDQGSIRFEGISKFYDDLAKLVGPPPCQKIVNNG